MSSLRLLRGAPSRRQWSRRHLHGRLAERRTRHRQCLRNCSRVVVKEWVEDASAAAPVERILWLRNVGTMNVGIGMQSLQC
jgi:hypothetical protein